MGTTHSLNLKDWKSFSVIKRTLFGRAVSILYQDEVSKFYSLTQMGCLVIVSYKCCRKFTNIYDIVITTYLFRNIILSSNVFDHFQWIPWNFYRRTLWVYKNRILSLFGLIRLILFYAISTLVGYLMPNSVYTYRKISKLFFFGMVWFYGTLIIVGYFYAKSFLIHINSSISDNSV